MWQLMLQYSISLSPVVLHVAYSGLNCALPRMFPMQTIAYTGPIQRWGCHVQQQAEMSCTVGGGYVSYSRRRRCFVWLEIKMSSMAGHDDVPYGQRWQLTLVWADGIRLYWYFHIYNGLVALLDRIQSSFTSITISTGYTPGACFNLYSTNTLFITYN